jgi:dihydroxy-acid dehydratase
VLKGNLAPNGAVIKQSAMEERFLKHTGPAVVFENYNELAAKIDDPNLDVSADSILVLKNAGPLGGPGMPEWGMLPIPKKLLQAGVRDMVRISDSRMSGTSYGSCVLHVAPEAYVGGPLAFVENGDPITLDVKARRLDLEVAEDVLAKRKAKWKSPPPRFVRGYGVMFANHASQADKGCDFNFLEGTAPTAEPEIH